MSKERGYEIKVDDKVISITPDEWINIQTRVRNGIWFYIFYKNKKYKYIRDITFMDRSTIFCFESLADGYDEKIDIIVIQ